jgi:hypothetical protein
MCGSSGLFVIRGLPDMDIPCTMNGPSSPGLRVPLGASYEFDGRTGDLFLEVVPYLIGEGVDLDFAFGLRFRL